MVSYCDSRKYAEKVNLILNIVKNRILSSTYCQRVDIIISHMEIYYQSLKYDVTLAKCGTTASHKLNTMIGDFPTAKSIKSCSNTSCLEPTVYDLMYITYKINNISLIWELQQYLDTRISIENSKCKENYTSTLTTNISKIHLFIDVLFLEGKILYWNKIKNKNIIMLFSYAYGITIGTKYDRHYNIFH